MKFPLPNHPFRTVELTAAQCLDFECVTTALLDETLAEYDRFVHLENRTLSKKHWKAVKTREHLTVYKETQTHRSDGATPRALPQGISADAAVSLATNMDAWRLPKLLAVGSIVGTLDDVMYGVVAPDVKTMLLRSAYVQDELVDGGVLFHIKGATPDDPFRFLGVKWLVKAHPTAINAVVSPRDTVVIDATGLHTQPNGDRIGYHVFHSAQLPECPELKSHSILRGHLSSCYLFKQTLNGTVEVYMKTFVDPGGRLAESLAVASIANALIGCYKSVLCAQGKKLTWLIKRNAAERATKHRHVRTSRRGPNGPTTPTTPTPTDDKEHCCELCETAFRAYKVARGCVACLRSVCSRCQTSRKISHMQRGLQVKQTTVVVCTACTTDAAQLSAFDVARDEFVGRQVHQQSLMTDHHSSSDSDSWTASGRTLLTEEMLLGLSGNSPTELQTLDSRHVKRTLSTPRDWELGSQSTPRRRGGMAMCSTDQRYLRTDSLPSSASSTSSAGSLAEVHHRDQLLLQMNQLRLAAEQTYRITKQNESAMRFAPLRE